MSRGLKVSQILLWLPFIRTEKNSFLTSFKRVMGLLENFLFGPSNLDVVKGGRHRQESVNAAILATTT